MSKKHYKKPLIQQIDIDNTISVLMATDSPPAGPGETMGLPSSPAPTSAFENTPLQSSPSASSSPFGGSRPDYQ